MKLAYLTFSQKGDQLAWRLCGALGGTVTRCCPSVRLQDWTAHWFSRADGLVFVGAVGIAIRAIAPFLESKTTDPAVVVVDECGRYAVSLLSGHLGGANDLARMVAAVCGAEPVITTATDVNGVFAVDQWARYQNCRVANLEKIKQVSAGLLAGGTMGVYSPWMIRGEVPQGLRLTGPEDCQICLDVRCASTSALWLVPRILVLGLGCRKGTSREALEQAFSALLEQTGIGEQGITMVASIDLKREEPGIVEFCRGHGWQYETFSKTELEAVPGVFTASDFVKQVTGVDNVCERSAVLASGGVLVQRKVAADGITMALAQRPYEPNWRWQHG